jgi:hypothetical protein
MSSSPFLFAQPNTAIDDDLIQLCITAASYQWIWRTGRGNEGQIDPNSPFVAPVAYDEFYDGWGGWRQFLRNWPITSLTAVLINGTAQTISSGWGSPGIGIDQSKKSIFMRTTGNQSLLGRAGSAGFAEGIQNIEVKYMAGYSQVPPQVVKACTHMVAINYKRAGWLDMSSHSQASGGGVTGTTSYRSWIVPPEVQQVMNDFTRDWPV